MHTDTLTTEDSKLKENTARVAEATPGVANSYWIGFCKGLKDILDEQCKALMIVTPQEVEDKWEEYSAGFRKGKGGIRTGGNSDCYEQGYREGKEHMRTTKSLNE